MIISVNNERKLIILHTCHITNSEISVYIDNNSTLYSIFREWVLFVSHQYIIVNFLFNFVSHCVPLNNNLWNRYTRVFTSRALLKNARAHVIWHQIWQTRQIVILWFLRREEEILCFFGDYCNLGCRQHLISFR